MDGSGACSNCMCRHVCDSSIALYSTRCMKAMKTFDIKGLNGSGNRIEKSKSGHGESLSEFREWLKVKREINPYYAHGMDIKVLEEIWLFAQNNIKETKCK